MLAVVVIVVVVIQPQALDTPVCSSGKQRLAPCWAFLHKQALEQG